jgi:hypothetical protein
MTTENAASSSAPAAAGAVGASPSTAATAAEPSKAPSAASSIRQAPQRSVTQSRADGGGAEYSRNDSYSMTGGGGQLLRLNTVTRREKAKQQADAEARVKAANAVGGGKSITFWGGVAFLINNVTGGGMVLFPQVFQEAGWLVVILALLGIMILVTSCSFMLVEAMAMMPGNKRFGKRAEYTSITKQYLPKHLYWASQFFFNAALMTNGISSQENRH